MQLFDSERFQAEYRDFSQRISMIEKIEVKEELQTLLKRLVGEVRRIDEKHNELISSTKLPSTISDNRSSLVEIRKMLINKLKDCEQAKLIKAKNIN
jgi:predicted nuclease with TOPRIM domain